MLRSRLQIYITRARIGSAALWADTRKLRILQRTVILMKVSPVLGTSVVRLRSVLRVSERGVSCTNASEKTCVHTEIRHSVQNCKRFDNNQNYHLLSLIFDRPYTRAAKLNLIQYGYRNRGKQHLRFRKAKMKRTMKLMTAAKTRYYG